MTDYYDPLEPPPCEEQTDIRLRQTYVDGCPVLRKLRCHEVQAGQRARLLWNFHDPDGLTLNLDECVPSLPVPESSGPEEFEFDAVGRVSAGAVLRIRELSGVNPSRDRIHVVAAEVLDPVQGLVRSEPLPQAVVRTPGVYMEEWGWISSAGDLLFSNQCCTFVRRGLFGLSAMSRQQNLGPPTLEEIRLSIRDNYQADNPLLNDVEFDAAEIASAVLRPIQFWNETSPPLATLESTTTFPFREMWLLGIQAHLLELAAHHYRRNSLAYNAGGVAVDDKNKEQPYMAAAMAKIQQYQDMMRAKKIELNMRSFGGPISSTYANWY